MTRLMSQTCQYSFQGQELAQKIVQHTQQNVSGYWQHQFERLAGREPSVYWYLGISEGKVLCSGHTPWSAAALLKVVQRYVPQTRQPELRQPLTLLKRQVQEQTLSPLELWQALTHLGLSAPQMVEALRLKVLNDLDSYLLMGAGEALFIPDNSVNLNISAASLYPQGLIEEAFRRQQIWSQIKEQVPSLNLIPTLNTEAFERANLPVDQRSRIQALVQLGKPIQQISAGFAKDSLEIASIFARLVRAGLVTLAPPQDSAPSTIMIIDDSPLVLMQFQHWVTALGYPVVVCQNAETSIPTIEKVQPSSIFIDINMPGISGFELVRKIRQHPAISNIPLVILTGEQKLSNKWRAQWSGCDFLTKPLSMNDIDDFQTQLQKLLLKLAITTVSPQPN